MQNLPHDFLGMENKNNSFRTYTANNNKNTVNKNLTTKLRHKLKKSNTMVPDKEANVGGMALNLLANNKRSCLDIIIPPGTKVIPWGKYSNKYNYVGSVVIPASVEIIEGYAFNHCENIESLTFEAGSNLTFIGGYAFNSCLSLNGVLKLPASVKIIREYAFYMCGFSSVVFEEECQLISLSDSALDRKYEVNWGPIYSGDDYLFNKNTGALLRCERGNYNLTKINGYEVKFIGQEAFYCRGWEDCVRIPASVIWMDESAFQSSEFVNIIFDPKSKLETINTMTFSHCHRLKNVEIPASVTSIKERAFMGCDQLESIAFLPYSNIKEINFDSFGWLDNLVNVFFNGLVDPKITTNPFDMCSKLKNAVVPKDYKGTTWCGLPIVYCDTQWCGISKYEVPRTNKPKLHLYGFLRNQRNFFLI